jgi:hypothetical protein
MGKIILAPRAARLFNGKPSPKDYPWWPKVVQRLNEQGHEVIQIGALGEDEIQGVSQFFTNWPFAALKEVIRHADIFLTVDSWLPHFVYAEKLGKRGVVLWSQSDPAIWGHAENVNLLKDRKYLRPLQFQDWMQAAYNEDAFVSVDEVVNACTALIESTNRAGTVRAGV